MSNLSAYMQLASRRETYRTLTPQLTRAKLLLLETPGCSLVDKICNSCMLMSTNMDIPCKYWPEDLCFTIQILFRSCKSRRNEIRNGFWMKTDSPPVRSVPDVLTKSSKAKLKHRFVFYFIPAKSRYKHTKHAICHTGFVESCTTSTTTRKHTSCALSYSAIAGQSIDKEKGASISGLITVIEHSCCYKERIEAGYSTSQAFND